MEVTRHFQSTQNISIVMPNIQIFYEDPFMFVITCLIALFLFKVLPFGFFPHFVKSVQIQSYFWSLFPVFELNIEYTKYLVVWTLFTQYLQFRFLSFLSLALCQYCLHHPINTALGENSVVKSLGGTLLNVRLSSCFRK